LENRNENAYFKDLGVEKKIMFKYILKKYNGQRINSPGFGQGHVAEECMKTLMYSVWGSTKCEVLNT
jgi:hypothetical protein